MPISSAISDAPVQHLALQQYIQQQILLAKANYAITFSPSIHDWVNAPVVVFFLSAGGRLI